MSAPALPEGYSISADPALLDLDVIHGFVAQSYWAKGMPKTLVERMLKHSLCFGAYTERTQIGFARIISDYTTFAYLADVFVLPEHRGRGLSKALMQAVQSHPDLQGLRRWVLVTLDAQGLYEQFGFKVVPRPEVYMEIFRPGLYLEGQPPV